MSAGYSGAGHPGRLVAELPVPASESDWAFRGKPPPAVGNRRQLWAKPLQSGAVAVLVINASPHPLEAKAEELRFKTLNVTSEMVVVRDIWARKDLGKSHLRILKAESQGRGATHTV